MSRCSDQAPVDQRQRRRAQHPGPERKLADAARRPARAPQAAAPSAGTRCPRRQQSRAPRPQPPPRPPQGPAPGCATTPVHRKMMDRQQQTARRRRSGIEPHRLHHHARRRRKRSSAAQRRRQCTLRSAAASSPQTSIRAQAAPRIHRTRRRNRQRDLGTLPPPQPAAAATHRGDRAQPAAPQSGQPRAARRHLQQHRLVEALDRPAALEQPAHDRRRRQPRQPQCRDSAAPAGDSRSAAPASAATV